MSISRYIRNFTLFMGLVMVITGCAYDPHYTGPAHRAYYPYYYPYYYDYYYYPSVRVYFNYSTGYYYYPYRKRWIRSRTLPHHIHLDPRDRVIHRIENDKPYLKHEEHRKKYQARPSYRADPEIHRKEQTHNMRLYQQHQQKQQEYQREWEMRRKR